MKRLALASPVLALALAMLMPAAAQQPPPRTGPPTLSQYALLYLGDAALQKELKLSEAQVKKLNEQYPGVDQCYEDGCGYVHFSDAHLYHVCSTTDDGKFRLQIGSDRHLHFALRPGNAIVGPLP